MSAAAAPRSWSRAATHDVVALNARARAERVATGHVAAEGVELHDGNLAGVGDWVVTRSNDRLLQYGRGLGAFRRGGRWVHNGDTWRVTRRHGDRSLTVQHLGNRGRVRLPARYVDDSVELAYAATVHRVQGTTTDTAHALVTPEMTRMFCSRRPQADRSSERSVRPWARGA